MSKNNNQTLDELEKQLEQQQQQQKEQKEMQQTEVEQMNPKQTEMEMQQGVQSVSLEQKNDYVPGEGEKHLYHVRLEKPLYNSKTGERLSKPFIQKMTKAEYRAFVSGPQGATNADRLGYTVEVLWNPNNN